MPKTVNMGFRMEFKTNKTAEKKGEILVYSVISGSKWWGDETTALDFDKALKELGDVDEITIRINSPGGEVASAIAIRTALMKHKATKIVDIEGMCCSAATLIACVPGAKVRIAKGSDYMIHRCMLGVRGNVNVIRSAMESMINTDNAIADIYAAKTGKRDREGYLQLMDKTEWYDAEGAIAEGFADELIEAEEGEEPIAASAVTEEVYKVMQEVYDNVPDLRNIQQGNGQGGFAVDPLAPFAAAKDVSNEKKAVAAGNSSENMAETPTQGGTEPMENTSATAETVQQENQPVAAANTAETKEQILNAERERRKAIKALTPKGAKWQQMAEDAIDNGDTPEAFLQAIIAEQAKTGEEYLENRRNETKPAEKIGAGDAGDLDGQNAKDAEDKLAKEIADLAAGMDVKVTDMA